ncbi:uncharacterized protein [Dasypus novemcinctus]|uniref:uncharacterized protein n=1 Tax=Dasypus novemcinctus TaxID=9361 RepID=UPI00265F936F|nr:uncharacterized protein LOC101445173 [Dasypus novemcinctus]
MSWCSSYNRLEAETARRGPPLSLPGPLLVAGSPWERGPRFPVSWPSPPPRRVFPRLRRLGHCSWLLAELWKPPRLNAAPADVTAARDQSAARGPSVNHSASPGPGECRETAFGGSVAAAPAVRRGADREVPRAPIASPLPALLWNSETLRQPPSCPPRHIFIWNRSRRRPCSSLALGTTLTSALTAHPAFKPKWTQRRTAAFPSRPRRQVYGLPKEVHKRFPTQRLQVAQTNNHVQGLRTIAYWTGCCGRNLAAVLSLSGRKILFTHCQALLVKAPEDSGSGFHSPGFSSEKRHEGRDPAQELEIPGLLPVHLKLPVAWGARRHSLLHPFPPSAFLVPNSTSPRSPKFPRVARGPRGLEASGSPALGQFPLPPRRPGTEKLWRLPPALRGPQGRAVSRRRRRPGQRALSAVTPRLAAGMGREPVAPLAQSVREDAADATYATEGNCSAGSQDLAAPSPALPIPSPVLTRFP